MSLGKPVVITDVGGNRELVNHGENGLLIPPRDPQALADNVLTCLEQTERTQKIGQNAKETVLTLFSLDRMINNYQDLYEEAFRQKGRD